MLSPELSVQAQGTGPPAIIQGPGWGPASVYLRVTLAPLLRGLRVITYDVRNTGRSQRQPAPNSQAVDHLVEDLERVRASRRLERFVLVGHSHGTFVAMGYAIRHPQRLRALVLIAPSLDEPVVKPPDPQQLAHESDGGERLAAPHRPVESPRASSGLRGDHELARWVRRRLPLNFHDLDAMRRFQAQLIAAPAPSIDALRGMPTRRAAWVGEGLPELRTPTLIVAGRYDRITPPVEAARVRDRIRGARLAILEHSGHNPWVEEPERFSAIVQEFLSGL